jgi:CRP-like cAMP-binding protein
MRATRQRGLNNRLLAALPPEVVRSVEQLSQRVALETGDTISEPGKRLRYATFPETGVISVMSLMREGRTIEVANIGHEGMSGASALLGVEFIPYRYVVQVPGIAVRITIRDLAEIARYGSLLARHLHRYSVAFTAQVMQSVACAGLHSIEQRCCRWLLATHDRVDSDRFPVTHELLAMLLGARRSSVSDVLKGLRDRGLIEYHRGVIAVLDRPALERQCCECYRSVVESFAGILNRRDG